MKSPSYLLLNAPLADPTTPYHSLSYLVAAARHQGFLNGRAVDVNVEVLNYMLQPEQVHATLDIAQAEVEALQGKSNLTRGEQLRLRFALKAVGITTEDVLRARATLRNEEEFFDLERYTQSVLILNRWMDVLSLSGMPGQFDNISIRTSFLVDCGKSADLCSAKLLSILAAPFTPYWNDPFQKLLLETKWDVVGISANYVSQLPIALWIMKLVRAQCPQTKIVLGGTEITDVFKGATSDSVIWNVFREADVLVVGEGETAFVEILQCVQLGESIPHKSAGIFTKQSRRPLLGHYPVRYEDLSALPPPDYRDWNLSLYWSPKPILLYSPTRGCYWNRCTFCDYGLNQDSPTAPSREVAPDVAAAQLADIERITPYVYLAVDAMSPNYLRALAREIAKRGLRIRWSAELRLEPRLRKELSAELRQAGCVAISFGFESASQRILNMIDKGVRIAILPEILQQLKQSDIGVQMMGFIGFPGETEAEAMQTYAFLHEHRDFWTLAGIGEFTLTPGSIVAKEYQRFELPKPEHYEGCDIVRTLFWRGEDGSPVRSSSNRTPELSSLAEGIRVAPFDRPWLGGMDTAHSILYFARNGRRLFSQPTSSIKEAQSPPGDNWPLALHPRILSMVDVADVLAARKCIGGEALLDQWLTEQVPEPEGAASTSDSSAFILPSGALLSTTEVGNPGLHSQHFHHLQQLLLRQHGLA